MGQDMRQSEVFKLTDGVYKVESGLYLRVRGSSRSFFARLQRDGKRKDYTIGPAKNYTIAMAKIAMAKIRTQIVEGVDPVKKAPDKEPTFAEFAEATMDTIEGIRNWRGAWSANEWRYSVRHHALPVFGGKPLSKVTRDDVLAALKPLWETKVPTGSRLRGRLETIFDQAIFEGKHPGPNPALWRGNLDRYLPSPERIRTVKHHEAPTLEEAGQVVQLMMQSRYVTHRAIAFCILTAARANEVVAARWDEFDVEKAVWSCPRRKDGKPYPHRVPLSKQALTALDGLPRENEFVFQNAEGKHICRDILRKILSKRVKRHVTMHGCRSTFRDWAAENGISWALAEKSLMHSTGNAVERAYQRSDLLEQRRPVMQEWADALTHQHFQ